MGTYVTWDGDRYSGTWENDVLAKGVEARIEFGDAGAVYTGLVSNKMEYLAGAYQFFDGTQIKCSSFGKANVPLAGSDLEFSDARGVRWDCAMDNQWLIVRQPPRQFVPMSSSNGGDGDFSNNNTNNNTPIGNRQANAAGKR